MNTQSIAQLGILFLALGFAATFLMYHLWGYPFDKETRTSAAPRWAMYVHRALGYGFVIVYVLIMVHMVPRLWEYQVEFPARTTAHILLGFTVGFLLVLKIAIMRFFRHFEEWMPYLGTTILLCSVLLLALSIPFIFKERVLAARAPGGSAYSAASLERVARLLPTAGLPEDADVSTLATVDALKAGRAVLLDNCVKCHDLKTILTKPRTPESWYSTVVRMSEKPALFAPIDRRQELEVTAYLVAITPDLQKSIKMKRERQRELDQSLAAAQDLTTPASDGAEEVDETGDAGAPAPAPDVDPKVARETFELECSMCHELSDVDAAPPRTAAEVDELLQRMIEENDMEVEPDDLALIEWYMRAHYVDKRL